jgi:hypothetical protein
VENEAYRRVVARVAVLEGGIERLAVLLGVSSSLVTRWIEGLAPIPADKFLRCVDYLLDHNLPMGDVRHSVADETKPRIIRL